MNEENQPTPLARSQTEDTHSELEDIPACNKDASSIQAIDKGSVHRICSGQVVLTLATAVKELVENSIDAGASTVEIKLKDYGIENIEVIDNGYGVEEKNFEGLTLKHHTSKLQDFEDLINVNTFGFRGEALSSLCALSHMTITTRHKSASVGTRLEFDINGRITLKKSSPRQIGTTVQIQNIFHTLPVRHKEFHRNVKKEFAKLVQVLNAYCIVSTGVRITCFNQTNKGSRNTVVSTSGNDTIKDNISNVFSPKQLNSLLEFKQIDANDDVCSDFGLNPSQKTTHKFRIEGFISKCEHGQGRSSSDRQFIFINKRPCDAVKVLKVVNEIYHSYNRHQNPFIALNISMDKDSVDVNVTPDKRQIFVEGERLLLAVLKSSLINMFESTTSVYKVNNVILNVLPTANVLEGQEPGRTVAQSPLTSARNSQDVLEPSAPCSLSKLKRSFSSAFDKNNGTSPSSTQSRLFKTMKTSPLSSPNSLPSRKGSIAQFFSRYSPKKSTSSPPALMFHGKSENNTDDLGAINVSSDCNVLDHTSLQCIEYHNTCSELKGDSEVSCEKTEDTSEGSTNLLERDVLTEKGEGYDLQSSLEECAVKENSGVQDSDVLSSPLPVFHEGIAVKKDFNLNQLPLAADTLSCSTSRKDAGAEGIDEIGTKFADSSLQVQQADNLNPVVVTDEDLTEELVTDVREREHMLNFSMSAIKKKIEQGKAQHLLTSSFCRTFRAKISPTDNKAAEEELQKEISKEMFPRMEILGQFNLGFIITKLGDDLFIVDQHATDEKFNFEMLQKHTVLQSQMLIAPQCMELTASNETILVDNLEIFNKNGFDFIVDPEASPTQRVKLKSAPASKNWSFGKEDIEELLFMLSDSPNVMCRPSRIRMMFASRACRKSIMIGTALNKSEMKKLVSHMGELDQPWNCPHGRPTIRHLFNLGMLPS